MRHAEYGGEKEISIECVKMSSYLWLCGASVLKESPELQWSAVFIASKCRSPIFRYTFGQPVPGKASMSLCRDADETVPQKPCSAPSVEVRASPNTKMGLFTSQMLMFSQNELYKTNLFKTEVTFITAEAAVKMPPDSQ